MTGVFQQDERPEDKRARGIMFRNAILFWKPDQDRWQRWNTDNFAALGESCEEGWVLHSQRLSSSPRKKGMAKGESSP